MGVSWTSVGDRKKGKQGPRKNLSEKNPEVGRVRLGSQVLHWTSRKLTGRKGSLLDSSLMLKQTARQRLKSSWMTRREKGVWRRAHPGF